MDAPTKALESAAFHAWLTLGELREGHTVSREEIEGSYAALQEALEAFRAAHGRTP